MSELVPADIKGRNARLVWRRVAQRSEIAPGEAIRAAFTAQKRLPVALLLVIGEILYLLLPKPYYIGVTDRRVLLFTCSRLSGRIGELVWADPVAQVELRVQRRGLLRDVVAVERKIDGSILRLRVHRIFRDQLARALAPPPPPSAWGS